ncbi:MAG TPA: cation diffusion facilitator family transporter [Marmoricola sp.]|nr:cation diffusion facilitator family transporter [Marmoricola sp.]
MTHKLREHAHHDHDHHDHDHHDHDHDHHGLLGGVLHFVSEIFGWHSHDSAESIDSALEADARGRRALWISLIALAITSGLQAVVFAMTNSVALLGDTLHNTADALTAVPLLIAFWLLRKPANDRFTYGYGRAEDVAGLFVVLAVLASAVLAAYEAIDRLVHPAHVSNLGYLAAAGVVGFLGNEFVARYRIHVGRQIGSAALVADGLHARTDGFASLSVVLSAGGLALGWHWADPLIGIVIAIAIVGVLKSVIVQVGERLLDAVNPELVDRARHAVEEIDEVIAVDDLRIRWIGHSLLADVKVTVPAELSLVAGHDVAHHAEEHLLEELPRLASAVVHVSPTGVHQLSA